MEVTDALMEQWEPKVHSMLRTIDPNDYDDVAQEMRIAIIKAARGFDETKGIKFHTYLHVVMINHRNTWLTKNKKKQVKTTEMLPSHDALAVKYLEEPMFMQMDLTEDEQNVANLLAGGYTFRDLRALGADRKILEKAKKGLRTKMG
jgi:RNA polymerase sigma factor (sigma-70 family)